MNIVNKPQFDVPVTVAHCAVQVNLLPTERSWRIDRFPFKSGEHMLVLDIRPLEIALLTYEGKHVIIKVSDVASGDIEIIELGEK